LCKSRSSYSPAFGTHKEAKGHRVAVEGLTARLGAVRLLTAVLQDGAMLSQVLAEPGGLLAGMGPDDTARAQRLCLTVLRQIERADAVLQPLMRKAPPLFILNVLRLAVVELDAGAAPHGVVHVAVECARSDRRAAHFAGLVNAVLRKVPAGPVLQAMPVPKMPRWLRQPMVHAYGREAVAAIEAVQTVAPPIDITFKAAAAEKPDGVDLPNGSRRLKDFSQVSRLPGYASGDWWVQDAAAAMAVQLLAPKAGERVLDLCAAPGGKTLQLADAGAVVTAVDISAPRAARLRENLARTRLSADVVIADALVWEPEGSFDAILLDAPCSASGTLRRHPDLPFVKDGSDLPSLVALQAQLTDRALGMLKPGGRLVYCVCSLLPDEAEAQLAAALARHPGLKVQKPAMPWVDPAWITPEGGLRLRPDYWADLGGMDGFFMALLTA
jgi:16S rRNA (cytosine967-C5)-methyltransferase